MTNYLIHNAHIYGADRDWSPGWLATEGMKIRLMGAGFPPQFPPGRFDRTIDAAGNALLPGFIDLHTHGALGHEAMDASEEGLKIISRFFADHGVTSFLPTTWTAPGNAISRVLETVSRMNGQAADGATILGVHLEGPFLNPARAGAQAPELILKADELDAIPYLESGLVKLITLAPEFEQNLRLLDECVRRGITVSVGHSSATYEQVLRAAERGLSHATHTYNAMTPLGHRELGTVGAVMSLPQITCELISDNIHVHPAAQKILIDVKGPSGVVLVTDAIRSTGLPDGEYLLDDRKVTIKAGAVRLPDGSLAGSTLTMERALRNALAASGRSLAEIWPMASLNAAREIGVSARKGSLEVGKDADLVLLDEDFRVIATFVEGRLVFEDTI